MKKLVYILFLCLVMPLFLKAQQTVELCEDNQKTFTYSSSVGVIGTYVWTIDDSINFNVNPLTYTWETPGEHEIKLVFTSIGGCQDSVTYKVLVIECEETTMWFPNAFTPNQSGKNETWSPKGFNYTNLQYYVYNRWGEQIYQSDSELSPWDGTYKGRECQQDVYVYVATWRTAKGTLKKQVGHIVIIK